MIEVYRGTPNTWECDEMGHMNVRFYLAKLMEGIGAFCYHVKMPNAFRVNAPSTVQLRDLHIRFVKEAPAGAPLYITAGVVEIHHSSAQIYMQMNHLDGSPCAVFRFWMDHIDIHTGLKFLWSPLIVNALENFPAEIPEKLAPRSISFDIPPQTAPTLADVKQIKPPQIGTGLVLPEHCDVFNKMKLEFFIGRISDSAPHLVDANGIGMTRSSPRRRENGLRIGTAALEYRFSFHNVPVAGDTFALYAGLGQHSEKTFGLYYWLMDPFRNITYATAQATLIQFDLDLRKAITPSPDAFEAMKAAIPPGMWL